LRCRYTLFLRICRLNWIGLINRMTSITKVSQVFTNKPQGNRLLGRPKTAGGIVCKQILMAAQLKTAKRG
jgi:hypothetical protein